MMCESCVRDAVQKHAARRGCEHGIDERELRTDDAVGGRRFPHGYVHRLETPFAEPPRLPARAPEDERGAAPVLEGYVYSMEPAHARRLERDAVEPLGSAGESASSLPKANRDYLDRNRNAWQDWAATHIAPGRRAWQTDELRWGLWDTPESRLQLFKGFGRGDNAVELGCGTAAVSAWATRSGIRAVGVDFARAQLKTAEALQDEFETTFPLVYANAEEVPYDRDSFDLAVSEYGVSLWSDPRNWLPEAYRLLRPEGRLVFFAVASMLLTCTPASGGAAEDRLVRSYFDRYRVEFDPGGPVEFHLTHGNWIGLLRANGFVVDALIEVRPPEQAKPRFHFVSAEWAHHWPTEEIWIAHKAG